MHRSLKNFNDLLFLSRRVLLTVLQQKCVIEKLTNKFL
jgi:hypothetical protein